MIVMRLQAAYPSCMNVFALLEPNISNRKFITLMSKNILSTHVLERVLILFLSAIRMNIGGVS